MEGFNPNVIEAHVFAWGVGKRCRKLDRHMFELGDHDPNTIDRSALMAKAKATVTTKLKSVDSAWLYLNPTEIKPETHLGFTSRISIPTDAERIPLSMEN